MQFGWEAVSLFAIGDVHSLAPDVESEPPEKTHVQVRDPHHRQGGHRIATPPRVQKMESGYSHGSGGDVETEAELARKEVEELTLQKSAAGLAMPLAPVPRLAEKILVGDCPGYGCDRNRQDRQLEELRSDGRYVFF